MKKAGIITASVLLVLLLAAWIVPVFFQEKIVGRLQEEIHNRVNAQVHFKPENVTISLFSHFPNLTITTDNLTIIGNAPFQNDTLIATRSLEASVNLFSALSGDKLSLKGVYLREPRLLIKRLRDGRANYDIYRAVETDEPGADTSAAAFTVAIDDWRIRNGLLRYEDLSLPLSIRLDGVDHRGSGSLSSDLSDMALTTSADRLTLNYDGIDYLSNKKLDADMKLRVNLPASTYTFTDNRIRLNELPIRLNGTIALGSPTSPADSSIHFDLAYEAGKNNLKHLLSLVPGLYSEQFRKIDADGDVRFGGHVKGAYNNRQFPAFDLSMLVEDGRFKYADLPSAVDNINLNLTVRNTTDRLENTLIDLKNLAASLGKNPIRARVRLQGLTRSTVDADVNATLDLAELTQLFPLDSLTLRGLYTVNMKAKGVYDKAAGQFPIVDALMQLQNGYARSLRVSEPLEQIHAVATLTNHSGLLTDTRLDLEKLALQLAGKPFQMKGRIQDFNDYAYNLTAKGQLDLTKLARIFPVEGATLAGLIDADIQTQGRISDVRAKRYARLPAVGAILATNLRYQGDALPQGLTLSNARFNLAPGQLTVQQARGSLGTTAFTATGSLSNYLPFLLEGNQPLEGKLTVQADRLNLNEWMTENPAAGAQTASVIEIPKNIRFNLTAALQQALYDEMPLNNIRGQVEIADGVARLKQMTFNSLGGRIVTSGVYDPKEIAKPRFSFDVSIDEADIAQAYRHLSVTKIVFPLARYIFGDFSSKFTVSGLLGQDMLPRPNTLTGNALVRLVRATLQNNPVVEKIIQKTRLSDLQQMNLKDLLMKVEVKNGYVAIRPFDVKVKDYLINVSGSNSLAGNLNYTLKLDVPTGRAGTQFAGSFAALTGVPLAGVDRAKLDFALKGTYQAPQVQFLASSTARQVKDILVQQARKPLGQIRDKALSELEKRTKVYNDSFNTAQNRRRRESGPRPPNPIREEGVRILDRLRKAAKDSL